MNKYLLILILIGLKNIVFSQDYNVNLIADSLRENADAVVRESYSLYKIYNEKTMLIKEKKVVTILNEKAKKYTNFVIGYNKTNSLEFFKGKLYDNSGKLIKVLKKSDLIDYGDDGESDLKTDNRYKTTQFYYSIYPFTIEFEYELECKYFLNLPHWITYDDFNESIQKTSICVEIPKNYAFKYKLINFNNNPVINNTNNNFNTYNWEFSNLKSIEKESLQPSLISTVPSILFALNTINFYENKVSVDNWQSFGNFFYSLFNIEQELPQNVKLNIHQLTDTIKIINDKIKAVYNYLQNNTRYISIQLGIGGFKPLNPQFVAKNKFGDCKALSYYMVSLLKEIQIKAYCVLIKAGKTNENNMFFEDFVKSYFNHVIVFIPQQADSIWLECTSQTIPFNYLSSFTHNRKGLLLDSTNSRLIETPKYTLYNNLQNTLINAKIDEGGNLQATIHKISTGIQSEEEHHILYNSNQHEKDVFVNEMFSIPSYKINYYTLNEIKNKIPYTELDVSINAPFYAVKTGKKLYFKPNLINRGNSYFSKLDKRRFPIVINFSYIDNDTLIYKIPAEYMIESMPEDYNIKNKFGTYQIQFKYNFDENTFVVIRQKKQFENIYNSTDFLELNNFFTNCTEADNRFVYFKQRINK